MVQAAIDVNGMRQQQKVRLADEIFAREPKMLASTLAWASAWWSWRCRCTSCW
jgi:hypothetical protein